MSDKGLFTKEQEKIFGQKLDALIDFKKIKGLGMLEIFDGFLFTTAISFVDDKYGEYLPVQYKELVGQLVVAVTSEDWVGAQEPLELILDLLIDIPFVDGEEEAWLIKAIVEAAFGILLNTILKKATPVE